MIMEQAVHQKKYSNEWHRLRVNILYTSGWLKNEIKDFLDPFEVTQQQFNILRILRGQHPDGISTKDICERMIDRKSDTSRLVARLKEKGLVEKCEHPEDKRQVCVTITDCGLKLLKEIDDNISNLDNIFEGLNKTEANQLNELLSKACSSKDN